MANGSLCTNRPRRQGTFDRDICRRVGLLVLLIYTAWGQTVPQKSDGTSAQKTFPRTPKTTAVGATPIYRNPMFGFSYRVPFGWVDRTKEMKTAAVNPSEGDVLFAAFERPPEAVGETINSAVIVITEKASVYKGLKSAVDYFGPLTDLITTQGFKVVNGPYDFPIGARGLVRGDFSRDRGTQTMYQSTLAMIEKGSIVSFTFIAGSEDEEDSLIENLKFAPKSPSPAPSTQPPVK